MDYLYLSSFTAHHFGGRKNGVDGGGNFEDRARKRRIGASGLARLLGTVGWCAWAPHPPPPAAQYHRSSCLLPTPPVARGLATKPWELCSMVKH